MIGVQETPIIDVQFLHFQAFSELRRYLHLGIINRDQNKMERFFTNKTAEEKNVATIGQFLSKDGVD